MQVYLGLITALLLSMLLVPMLMRWAVPLGLLDRPDARKSHTGVIPRVGGLAIAAGTLFAALIWLPEREPLAGFALGAFIIVLAGALDDRFDLSYLVKFAAQLAAIATAISSGIIVEHLPFFGYETVSPWLGVPATALFLLIVTNAFNLLDGLDGLAAGCAVLSLAAIAALAAWCAVDQAFVLAALAIGGILGFLRYNTHPATVFMGDAGSQFLGFTIGVAVILLLSGADNIISPSIAVFLVGLPALDTLSVMVQRVRAGQSPFRPDRNHVHHKLLSLGLHHHEAVAVIYGVQALMVVLALLLKFEADWLVLGAYALTAGAGYWLYRTVRRADPLAQRQAAPAPRNEDIAWLPPGRRAALLFGLRQVLQWGAGLALIALAAVLTPVGPDLGWASLAAAALLALLSVSLPGRRDLVARIAVGVTAITFSTLALAWGTTVPIEPVANLVLLALAGAVGLTIYLLPRDQFAVTPLDFLILLLAVGVMVAPFEGTDRVAITLVLVRAFTIIYAGEVLLSLTPARPALINALAIGALAVLGVSALTQEAPPAQVRSAPVWAAYR